MDMTDNSLFLMKYENKTSLQFPNKTNAVYQQYTCNWTSWWLL